MSEDDEKFIEYLIWMILSIMVLYGIADWIG